MNTYQVESIVKFSCLIILISAIPFYSFAQVQSNSKSLHLDIDFEDSRELFSVKNIESAALATNAFNRWNRFNNQEKSRNTHLVSLPEQLYKHKVLSVNLTTDMKELVFSRNVGKSIYIVRNQMNKLAHDRYSWVGSVYEYGTNNEIGQATFIQDIEGNVDGTIDVMGQF
jgi:hypothetical protein